MTDTSQTLYLALIGCVDPGAVDSCKSNYSHWVEPETVDFYTADLYLILPSDHNDNFSKNNIKKLQTTALKSDSVGNTTLHLKSSCDPHPHLSIKARNLCLSVCQRHICLDYNDTVNKLFHKCFMNSASIVKHSHHNHVRTRANHCRAHPNNIP